MKVKRNIYQMYHDNKCKFGFYVIKDSWRTIVAKVISIQNVKEGEKIIGNEPYYNNPLVTAEFYKVDDNEKINIDDLNEGSRIYNSHTDILSVAGSYAYKQINVKENNINEETAVEYLFSRLFPHLDFSENTIKKIRDIENIALRMEKKQMNNVNTINDDAIIKASMQELASATKYSFQKGAKWYREQLKSRQ